MPREAKRMGVFTRRALLVMATGRILSGRARAREGDVVDLAQDDQI